MVVNHRRKVLRALSVYRVGVARGNALRRQQIEASLGKPLPIDPKAKRRERLPIVKIGPKQQKRRVLLKGT